MLVNKPVNSKLQRRSGHNFEYTDFRYKLVQILARHFYGGVVDRIKETAVPEAKAER
jgi:hypothetical protein